VRFSCAVKKREDKGNGLSYEFSRAIVNVEVDKDGEVSAISKEVPTRQDCGFQGMKIPERGAAIVALPDELKKSRRGTYFRSFGENLGQNECSINYPVPPRSMRKRHKILRGQDPPVKYTSSMHSRRGCRAWIQMVFFVSIP
jgi:hypothetical protein